MRIEQSELRDAARGLLEGVAGADPAETWRQVVEAGFVSIAVPDELGGLGQPLDAACWLHIEMGRAVAPVPLIGATAALGALAACPASPARDAAIAQALAGAVPAVSLLDKGGFGTGNGVALIGMEGPTDATDVLLVGEDIALVPLAGLAVIERTTWDASRHLREVVLGDVADEWVLASGDDAARAAAAFSTHLHFAVAADCVGGAEAILEQTVAYLQTRRQFDRPLAMFQALKHRCADLKAMLAAAEALLADHLQSLDAGEGDPVLLARAAKALCSTTFRAIAEEAVQLHGGMGMTEEHPCHLYLKRALLNEHLGSADDACDVAVGAALVAAL